MVLSLIPILPPLVLRMVRKAVSPIMSMRPPGRTPVMAARIHLTRWRPLMPRWCLRKPHWLKWDLAQLAATRLWRFGARSIAPLHSLGIFLAHIWLVFARPAAANVPAFPPPAQYRSVRLFLCRQVRQAACS